MFFSIAVRSLCLLSICSRELRGSNPVNFSRYREEDHLRQNKAVRNYEFCSSMFMTRMTIIAMVVLLIYTIRLNFDLNKHFMTKRLSGRLND